MEAPHVNATSDVREPRFLTRKRWRRLAVQPALPLHELDEYRYERKFLLAHQSRQHVDALIRLNPACFRPIHQGRYINNIYWDTPSRTYYHAATAGQKDRAKVRIRWHGEKEGEISAPVLEFKLKRGVVGCKRSYALPAFHSDEVAGMDWRLYWETAQLPDVIREQLRGLEPALLNRYYRTYHQSADRRYRITVDTQLSFEAPDGQPWRHGYEDEDHCVVELKYAVDAQPDAQQITNAFPFRLSRSSKYVMGISHFGQ